MSRKHRPGFNRKGTRLKDRFTLVRQAQGVSSWADSLAKRMAGRMRLNKTRSERRDIDGYILSCNTLPTGAIDCKVLDKPYPILFVGAEVVDGEPEVADWFTMTNLGRSFHLLLPEVEESYTEGVYPNELFDYTEAKRAVPSVKYGALDVDSGDYVVSYDELIEAQKLQVVPAGEQYCGLRMLYRKPQNQNPDGSFPAGAEYPIPFFEVSLLTPSNDTPTALPETGTPAGELVSGIPQCFVVNYNANLSAPTPWGDGWKICQPLVAGEPGVTNINAPEDFIGVNGSVCGLWGNTYTEQGRNGAVIQRTEILVSLRLMKPRELEAGPVFLCDVNGVYGFTSFSIVITRETSARGSAKAEVETTYHPVVPWPGIIAGNPRENSLNPAEIRSTRVIPGRGTHYEQDFYSNDLTSLFTQVAKIGDARVGLMLLAKRTLADGVPEVDPRLNTWEGMALVTFVNESYTVQDHDYHFPWRWGSSRAKDFDGPVFCMGGVSEEDRVVVLLASVEATVDEDGYVDSSVYKYTVWVGTANGFVSYPVTMLGVAPFNIGFFSRPTSPEFLQTGNRETVTATVTIEHPHSGDTVPIPVTYGLNTFRNVSVNSKRLVPLGQGQYLFVVRNSVFNLGDDSGGSTDILLYKLTGTGSGFFVESVSTIATNVPAVGREGALTVVRPRIVDPNGPEAVTQEAHIIFSYANSYRFIEEDKSTYVSIDSGVTWKKISSQGCKDGVHTPNTSYQRIKR